MEPLVIGSRPRHWIVMLIGSLGFVAAGVLILAKGEQPWVGWMSILFFGACAIVFLAQLLDTRPRIIIDERGVFDRTLRIGVIEWSDIRKAYVQRMQSNVFICLEIRDPEKYLGKLSPTLQRIAHLNERLGYADLNLNLSGTDVDPERVCELILKEVELRRSRGT